MAIYFHTARGKYGFLSNFAPYGVEFDGLWYPTAEHYFQAQKFAGTPLAEQIRSAATPKEANTLGRHSRLPLRADWEAIKDEVMLTVLRRKFAMHKELRKLLLATSGEELIEDDVTNEYWACGANGKGKNRLGQLLMQVRQELRSNRCRNRE
jgi:N-glycosidase YbiA